MAHAHFIPNPFLRKPLQVKMSTTPRYRWRKIVFFVLLACFTLGFNQPIEANSNACLNLLTDNGLEDIAIWQAKSNDDFPLFSTLLTHSGTHAAYLAGRNNAVDRLATTFELPATNTVTLSFWWQLQSQEEERFDDKLAILIVDGQGHLLQQVSELSGRDHSNQWQQRRLDLSKWAGQTIGLQLLAQTNGELVTDFFVDDIAVIACQQSS